MLEWMAYAMICAALIAGAAACVDTICAALRCARRGVWISAIVASGIAPLMLPFRSHANDAMVAPPTASGAVAPSPSAPPPHTMSLDAIVIGAWAVASSLFAMVLLVAHRRTSRALEQCRPGTIGGRAAFISSDFGPAVVGVVRHHIVVPSWTLGLPDAEQRLVVAHELEHARSGDPLLSLAGVFAVVLMPWNAALWWQLSRLRLAIELDCDARVVSRRRNDTVAYSQLLLAVGERGRSTRQPVLAMSRSRSALSKRFDALLQPHAVSPRRMVVATALGLGTLVSVAFVPAPDVSAVIDAMRPQPTVSNAPVPPAGAVTRRDSSAFSGRYTLTPNANAAATATARPNPRTTRAAGRRNSAVFRNESALPPVSVVPSTAAARGPLDSIVVTKATLPPVTMRRGGVITAVPMGTLTRGGFSAAPDRNRPLGPDSVVQLREISPRPAGDSNRVVRSGGGGRGGRATLIARPDSSKPPR